MSAINNPFMVRRAQGYQRFPAVDPNIVLYAVPAYRASIYLVYAFPAHSIQLNIPHMFSNPQRWNVF